jgi:hypothetical protein
MSANYAPMSFRASPRERGIVEELALRLGVSRTEVLRLAVRALDERVQAGEDPGTGRALSDGRA